jgi:hypothetical protein
MIYTKSIFLLLYIVSLATCLNIRIDSQQPQPQPQIQLSEGTFADNSTDLLVEVYNILKSILATLPHPIQTMYESDLLPNANTVHRYDNSSDVFKLAVFYANMCKTSNCRASFDKWDCENCKSTLPDGVVVRAFQTYPLGMTGEVIISEK